VSTILKALQRLEDEKSSGKDRSLNEQVVARRSGGVAKSRWAVIGIALLSGIAVGSTALFFWPDGGTPAANGVAEADQPVVASGITHSEPGKRVPESPAKSLGTADAAGTKLRERAANRAAAPEMPMVEVVQRLEAEPPEEPVVAEPSASRPDGPGTKRPGDRRRAASQRARERLDTRPSDRANPRPAAAVSKRVPDPQVAAQPIVIAAVDPIESAGDTTTPPVDTTTPPVERAAVIADPPLGVAEPSEPLSASTTSSAPPTRDRKVIHRAEIPLISVGKTIWHPDADRRLAIVELTESGEELRLKEGDAVGPLVIDTIRPSGVLFVHDGVQVEYRVGQ
jgi:hypothetical protein